MQQANIIKEGAIFLHFEELQKKGLFYCRATHNFLFVYFTQNEKVCSVVDLIWVYSTFLAGKVLVSFCSSYTALFLFHSSPTFPTSLSIYRSLKFALHK